MKEKLDGILQSTLANIEAATDVNALNDIKVAILGKKGELTQVLKSMKDVAPEDRPKVGQMVNDVRQEIEASLEAKTTAITRAARAEKMTRETIDVTLPGVKKMDGHRHPNQIALEDLERVFIGMGYEIAEGPEVEKDYYNFEALNIPKDHPARDTQDTFYITDKILLRSQTSPVQARTMEVQKPPIRIISPGRVYRSDAMDATHSPLFHQFEGLVVDKGITMGDLKGTLEVYAKKMFGEKASVMTKNIPFDEYVKLLWKVDIAVFDFDRPCGLGNMRILLYMGKKVFIPGDNDFYKFLTEKGIQVFDTNKIPEMTYEEFIAPPDNTNLEWIRDYMNNDSCIHRWMEMFDKLAEND